MDKESSVFLSVDRPRGEQDETVLIGSLRSSGRARAEQRDQRKVLENYSGFKAEGIPYEFSILLGAGHVRGEHNRFLSFKVVYDGNGRYLFSLERAFFHPYQECVLPSDYVFLEAELLDILPTRDLIFQIKEQVLAYYNNALKRGVKDLDSQFLYEMLSSYQERLPLLYFPIDIIWVSDLMFGIAWKLARRELFEQIFHKDSSDDFWSKYDHYLGVLRSECRLIQEFSAVRLGSFSLLGSWFWSWMLENESFQDSFVYTADREHGKLRNEARTKLAENLGRAKDRLLTARNVEINVLGGLPGIGKSTLVRALIEKVNAISEDMSEGCEVFADVNQMKTEGHLEEKRQLTLAIDACGYPQFCGLPDRVKLLDGGLIFEADGSFDGTNKQYRHYRQYEELWQIYLTYTALAARRAGMEFVHYCENQYPPVPLDKGGTKAVFETMSEVPMVFSFVLEWERILNTYISEHHPNLFKELEDDVSVEIPEDLRIIIERLLLQNKFLENFLTTSIGKCWVVDSPVSIVRERILAERDSGVESRRWIYLRFLPLMRLTNLVTAKMFPRYFRVVKATREKNGGLVPYEPARVVMSMRTSECLLSTSDAIIDLFRMWEIPTRIIKDLSLLSLDAVDESVPSIAEGIARMVYICLGDLSWDLPLIKKSLSGKGPRELEKVTGYKEIVDLQEINLEIRRREARK